jgi:hypothetical protein
MLLEDEKSYLTSQKLLPYLQKNTKRSSRGFQIGVSKEQVIHTYAFVL